MATLAKFFDHIGAINTFTLPFGIIDIVPQGSANFESDKMHILVERIDVGLATDAIILEFKAVEGSKESQWAEIGTAIVLGATAANTVKAGSLSIPFNGQFRFKVSVGASHTYKIAITF